MVKIESFITNCKIEKKLPSTSKKIIKPKIPRTKIPFSNSLATIHSKDIHYIPTAPLKIFDNYMHDDENNGISLGQPFRGYKISFYF